VARRREEGDGQALDHVRNASVTLLVLDGIGTLVGELDDQHVRDLLAEIVDEVDALAADLGLERVKATGTTYYAVCGVSRPLLDHAPRSVTFALGARDLVRELSGGRLTMRAGIHSGPLTVGLTTRGALVYDVWGATVNEADRLARSAPTEGVMVSGSVREQLPAEFVVAGGTSEASGVVTDRVTVGGPA
jgi:class 3 adenylate cyclase